MIAIELTNPPSMATKRGETIRNTAFVERAAWKFKISECSSGFH